MIRKTKSTLKQCAALVFTVSGIALITMLFVFVFLTRDAAAKRNVEKVGTDGENLEKQEITATLTSYRSEDAREAVDVSLVRWNYREAFIYDGAECSVELLNVPDGISVEYVGNRHTDAGYYLAEYEFLYDESLIRLIGAAPSALEWQIRKATPDVSDFIGITETVVADGREHTVNIPTLETSEIKPVIQQGKSEPGKHEITIEFETSENYLAASPVMAELIIEAPKVNMKSERSYSAVALMEALGSALFIFNLALTAMLIAATVLLCFAFIDRRAVKKAIPRGCEEQEYRASASECTPSAREENYPSLEKAHTTFESEECDALTTDVSVCDGGGCRIFDFSSQAAFAAPPDDDASFSDMDGGREMIYIGKRSVYVRYRSTFTSRLIQCGRETQLRYGEIKNLILSYSDITSRISQKHELFSLGKQSFAKINIKGKTLFVYLAIDPAEINAEKYGSYILEEPLPDLKFPVCVKIRSARSLLRAKELCRLLFNSAGLDFTERDPVDYTMPSKDSFTLAKEGIMKLILPRDVGDFSFSDIRRADVKAHILGSVQEYPSDEGAFSSDYPSELVGHA